MKLRVLWAKVREVLGSVLPIVAIVLLLHFTLTPLNPSMLWRFIAGSLLIIIGLSVFIFGIEIGITPLGRHIGSAISRPNRLWIIIAAGLIIGFFVSIAEPDLQILANSVSSVTSGAIGLMSILVIVSIGIAALLVIGLIRILYNFPLRVMLAVLYGVIGVLALFVSPEFLAISFDASGATTGALTVPFILALSVGISTMKKDSKSSQTDSFGLVAVTSTGAILGIMLMGIFKNITSLTGALPESEHQASAVRAFTQTFVQMVKESAIAILPLIAIFIFLQIRSLKLSRRNVVRLLKGMLYTMLGLAIFLTGVNAGFTEVGTYIGQNISSLGSIWPTIIVGFIIGFVTILAEPAVHVLTEQIETVTAGYVKRRIVLGALSIGVGTAIVLSILRVFIPEIQLWHYLLPGYIICIMLSFIVPRLFVGIAFDSGGVASGPMTATFILAFIQGVADTVPNADVLRDAFGMIALVAMTPIITLQILGLIVKIKTRKPKGGKRHE